MSATMQIEERAAEWLTRQDAGEWTAGDQQNLDQWLSETAAHRVAWLRLRAAWQRADALASLETSTLLSDGEAAAGRSPATTAPVQRAHRPRLHWLVLGCVTVVFAVSAWLGLAPSNGIEQHATAIGARQTISLADGSTLMLNTQSKARVAINSHNRQLWLDQGEAYLEVAHEPARPFMVTVGTVQLTVVGTRFAIREDAEFTRIAVLDGKVLLDRNPESNATNAQTTEPQSRGLVLPDGPIMLSANDVATIHRGDLLTQNMPPDQLRRDLSWREGKLTFDQRPLKEIAAEFNRYNRMQLIVDPSVADVRLGGSFDANNLKGFVRLVREGFGIKARVTEERIVLTK